MGNPVESAGAQKRAKALNAATASAVMANAGFSFVYFSMTAPQVAQMQRVLDAAVVDPVVHAAADKVYRAGTKIYGSLVIHDPASVRRSDRIMRDYIPVGAWDKRIRLNYRQLINATALAPQSDNPDEAEYLEKVRKWLDNMGVWLRFEPKLVRDPSDLSRYAYDPRVCEVWLSLGPDGDAIPTIGGRIDRAALIGTRAIGASYWDEVDQGPMETALERETNQLYTVIESGEDQHRQLAAIRRGAAPGVVFISDKLGGTSFPDYSIWNAPRQFMDEAGNLRAKNRLFGARANLVIAAMFTRNAANLLASYLNDSSDGVERSVKILKVVKTAGKVAEVGLALSGGVAIVRSGVAAVSGAGAAGAGDAAIDRAAKQVVERYIAKSPELAGELSQVRWVPGPKGTVLGNIKGGHSAGVGTGWQSW